MIWHPFVALGCVFMIERIVQEENLLFKCWFRLPYSCMPGMVYVQRAKKRRRLSSGIFFYTFTSIECPAVGCWDGSIFTVSSAAACACCMTVFVKAIFTFCARDAWCIAIDNAGISIASTSLSLHIGGVLRL